MKNTKNIIALSLVLLCLFFAGCKTAKQSAQLIKFDSIPAAYNDRKDSINSASINWRMYFNDSTLVSLIDTALKNNFDLMIAVQRIEAARAGIRWAKGALLPTISPAVSAAQRKYGLYTMDGAGNITTEITPGEIVPIHLRDYYVGLQSSWEIDIWGKLRNRKKAAAARYLASVEGKNMVITNLITEVANSYYELLSLDNELEIIQDAINLQQDALDMVRIQKQTGIVNELAVKQFESQVLESKILEKEVQQRIMETENKINFFLGRYPERIQRNKTEFEKPLTFSVHVGIPSDLLRNRPDIMQAEYNLTATKADVKAAKAAFYPSLNINGVYGFQAFKTSFLFTSPESIVYSIFGGLVTPLINRNAIKAEFKNASAAQRESLYNYQQSIVNGYVEVYNEVARIRNLQDVHEYRNSQVDIVTQSVEISSELFRTGRVSYLEVLLTQQNKLNSRLQLIDTKKRQYFAVINIYKALGGGW